MLAHYLFFALLSLAAGARADTTGAFQYCGPERVRFCDNLKAPADIGSCLLVHQIELSIACKQDLERMIQMRKLAAARGGGALSAFGGLNAMGPPVPLVAFDGRYSLGDSSPSFTENKLNISSPVYHADAQTVSLSMAGSTFHVGDGVYLDSGTKVPTDLYRIEGGAQYFDQLPERRNWSLRGSVGYAGDRPFVYANDTTYSLNANYGFPDSGHGFWILSVFFSNNSLLRDYIPIPGFAYLYKTDTFTGLFGFPILAMQWTPLYPWSFSLAIFGPTLQSEIAYGSIEHLQVFTGLYWIRQSYIPSQRENNTDRLTIEEKKVALGVRALVWGPLLAEVQAGQAFDRSIYIGSGLFNTDGGSVSIPSNWYGSVGLRARF
jgi:hypothetical protein